MKRFTDINFWSMVILWIIFVVLIYFKGHMSVYDIKDFHGAYMAESYLKASTTSKLLFALVVVTMVFSTVKLLKKRKIATQILTLLIGSSWIAYYLYICKKVPYFF
jgi:uncharacterized membrane protein (UPF0136 family)